MCECGEVFRGNQYCQHRNQGKIKGEVHQHKSLIYYCLHCQIKKEDKDKVFDFVAKHKECPSMIIDKLKIRELFNAMDKPDIDLDAAVDLDLDLEDDLRLTDSDDSDFDFVVGGDKTTSSPVAVEDNEVEVALAAITENGETTQVPETTQEELEKLREELKKLREDNERRKKYEESLKKQIHQAQRSEAAHHKSARDMRDQVNKVKTEKRKVESDLAQAQKFCAQHREDLRKHNECLSQIRSLQSEKKDMEQHNGDLIKDNMKLKEEIKNQKLHLEAQLEAKAKELGDVHHELHRAREKLSNGEKEHEVEIHIPIKNNRRCGEPAFFDDPNASGECFESEDIKCLHVYARGQGRMGFRIRNAPKFRSIGKLITIHILIYNFKISSFLQSLKPKDRVTFKSLASISSFILLVS